MWCPTASFDRVLGGPTPTTFLPLFPALLYFITSVARHPDFLHSRIAVALFFLGPLLVLLYLVRYKVASALGCVRVLRVRGSRALLLSLGYCEAELVTDGNVKVSEFRELGSYPVEYGGLPGDPPEDLRIRVGYFPPGKHEVEVRDCDFLFLRTRGFCLLYDSRGLPEGREGAFKFARWWEKFSMVYAALCLEREGVPDPERVEGTLDRVKNNRAVGFLVRYMNCWYCPKVMKQAGVPIRRYALGDDSRRSPGVEARDRGSVDGLRAGSLGGGDRTRDPDPRHAVPGRIGGAYGRDA
ncbi:hypothetical protein [Methanopyrus kandleri]